MMEVIIVILNQIDLSVKNIKNHVNVQKMSVRHQCYPLKLTYSKNVLRYFFYLVSFLCPSLLFLSCSNNPYPTKESNQNIYYTSFREEPKHLDPAMAYSSDEYLILSQIYEPPLQYHLLKRPYELVPTTLTKMPSVTSYRDISTGETKVEYKFILRQDINYQDHPSFAKREDGSYIYHLGSQEWLPEVSHPNQLLHQASRSLIAQDYVYQIKRLAHPKFACPIFPILTTYIDGFKEISDLLKNDLEKERLRRKKIKGAFYNQEADEFHNPIYLDLRKYNFQGVQVIDKYSFKIVLKKKYPQFIYWMAMPFFSPVPWEVDRFYTQAATSKKNWSLNYFPVGTGAYQLSVNQPNYRMVLEKNPNFHNEFYPTTGMPNDLEAGHLKSAGKKLPFIDKIVMTLEKEGIPRWNKFLQGYYDNSGISSDFFDSVVNFSGNDINITEEMKQKKISLTSSVSQVTYYYAFNMLDDIVGSFKEKNKKLRQAISIILNIEEFIQIFLNSRGLPAQSPIPPAIFGHQEGQEGLNHTVYEWDAINKKGKRKKVSEAKKLLTEAGYPNGRTPQGRPLVLYYDNVQEKSSEKTEINWIRKQFKKLGIDLQIRSTNYNQFRRKVQQGNFQIMRWGWHADYPDPENFLFLLYGPNGKVASGGENASNYNSPIYNTLFRKMEVMENTPLRLKIIRQMIALIRDDAPWIWGFHPVEDILQHSWQENTKILNIGSMNTMKYRKVNFNKRDEYRNQYNNPVLYPVWLGIIFALLLFYFLFYVKLKEKEEH